MTYEFVRGGGGKVVSSGPSRRDWFSSVDMAASKHSSVEVSETRSDMTNKEQRRDGSDRKKATPLPQTAEGSTRFAKSVGVVMGHGKEPKNARASKVVDSSQSSKSSASKEPSGGERQQVGTPKNMSATSSYEGSKTSKVHQSTHLESGWFAYLYA